MKPDATTCCLSTFGGEDVISNLFADVAPEPGAGGSIAGQNHESEPLEIPGSVRARNLAGRLASPNQEDLR
jgi:hypothetical protein